MLARRRPPKRARGSVRLVVTKSRKPRGVPLPRRTDELLRALHEQRPEDEDHVFLVHTVGTKWRGTTPKSKPFFNPHGAWASAVKRAGLQDLSLHDLRHTYASRLVQRGVPLLTLSQLLAEAFGYSADELSAIPAGANMGLSCGNPTATANLRPGEVVVDLGSGGGLDVFLAAAKVGPAGMAIGIDMTEAMIDRARKNAQRGPGGKPYPNVEFHLASIDMLPLPDASVDVVISNCVINLATDKNAVFREIVRVLKPGGRVAVSDIALKKPLPNALAESVMAYIGCIAGAIMIDEYTSGMRAAGFADVTVIDSGADLNAYAKVENQLVCHASPMVSSSTLPTGAVGGDGCCGSGLNAETVHGGLAELLKQYDVNDYAASVKVFAMKPH